MAGCSGAVETCQLVRAMPGNEPRPNRGFILKRQRKEDWLYNLSICLNSYFGYLCPWRIIHVSDYLQTMSK